MEQLTFTALLNRLFGAPVLALLQALNIHPKNPATPISNSFAMELLVVSVLLVGPAFWFYSWAGAIGFALGTVVSYVNFKSLTRGVEGLSDRIVNRNSREKGGWIVLRFVVRYGLVAAAAYAIFKSSPLAFRGFLWGLCVPVAALMAEAVWQGYMAFRRAS